MLTKSFATEKSYVLGQGRAYSATTLHVQFPNGEVNRAYGFAGDVEVPAEMLSFIEANKDASLVSKAGTGQIYAAIQARPRKGCIHFQVSGAAAPEWAEKAKAILPAEVYAKIAPAAAAKGNRSYGIAFDVPKEGNEELWAFLAGELLGIN